MRQWFQNWAILLIMAGIVVGWMLLAQMAVDHSAWTARIYMGVSFVFLLGYLALPRE